MSLSAVYRPKQYQALIHHIEQTPSGVLYAWLKPLSTFNYIHRPGQYLSLKIGEDSSYFSIASLPIANSLLELHLQIQDQTKIQFLLDAFADKRAVSIEYPFGLVDWSSEFPEAVLICRGTGFAPVKALAEMALLRNSNRPIVILWEADSFKELYFKDWLLQHLQMDNHLQVKLFSVDKKSQLTIGDKKSNNIEILNSTIAQYLSENFLITSPERTWFYLCASPNRVYTWVDILANYNIQPDQMASDVFEYAPRS